MLFGQDAAEQVKLRGITRYLTAGAVLSICRTDGQNASAESGPLQLPLTNSSTRCLLSPPCVLTEQQKTPFPPQRYTTPNCGVRSNNAMTNAAAWLAYCNNPRCQRGVYCCVVSAASVPRQDCSQMYQGQ